MKITLTKSELKAILQKHFHLIEDFELEITDEGKVNEPIVSTCKSAPDGTMPDENGWFHVPKDWNHTHPPYRFYDSKIEVEYRNGRKYASIASRFAEDWIQEDTPYDIVKFKPV